MLGFLLGLFRLVWLFGKGHQALVLENLALRQQLSIYRRKKKRPQLAGINRWFWIGLSQVWKDWRRAVVVVHSDTVVRWQREGFRRYWRRLSNTSRMPVGLRLSPRIQRELQKLGINVSA